MHTGGDIILLVVVSAADIEAKMNTSTQKIHVLF